MNQYAQMIRQLNTPQIMKQLTHLYGQRDGMLVEQTARPAAPKSAATTPTITRARCWPPR